MNLKEFLSAIYAIAEEKKLDKEKVLEVAKEALAAAYKKQTQRKGQKIVCEIDLKSGKTKFFQVLSVIEDKEKENAEFCLQKEKQIFLSEAKKIKKDAKAGEEILIELPPIEEFGRIASQTGKQVFLQKLREIEKETLFEEWKKQEEKVVAGTVQKVDKQRVFVNLGDVIGIIKKEDQIPQEFYRPGQRLKAYVLKVERTSRGPEIFLSRSFPKFVSKLLELEVPEIAQGQVKIVAIAREPGVRTKVAVKSEAKEIDPVGAIIGYKGTRIKAVIDELGGEKIDVVLFSESAQDFIKNAFSPAKIKEVKIEKNTASCFVTKDQASLAIGKDGINVKLVSKLTGFKIDIKEVEE